MRSLSAGNDLLQPLPQHLRRRALAQAASGHLTHTTASYSIPSARALGRDGLYSPDAAASGGMKPARLSRDGGSPGEGSGGRVRCGHGRVGRLGI
jgi:hypothetical protein